ncbi:MAG: hypothetical protein Q4G34_01280 [Micrococcus sp.]|nr:hypothetical protein [Micrococcus sp.]
MIAVEITPWDVREALAGALAAGQDMETNSVAVRIGGEQVAQSFGTASLAQQAFRTFWAAREELGHRAADTLAHNAARVSLASGEFVRMDADMQTLAEQTVSAAEAAEITRGLAGP